MRLAFVLALLAPAVSRAATADLIYINAHVVTVAGDKVLAAGSAAEMAALAGPATRVIDPDGKTMVPGFYDNHLPGQGGGLCRSE
jgi:predicted amidohydrolase YtcJ